MGRAGPRRAGQPPGGCEMAAGECLRPVGAVWSAQVRSCAGSSALPTAGSAENVARLSSRSSKYTVSCSFLPWCGEEGRRLVFSHRRMIRGCVRKAKPLSCSDRQMTRVKPERYCSEKGASSAVGRVGERLEQWWQKLHFLSRYPCAFSFFCFTFA